MSDNRPLVIGILSEPPTLNPLVTQSGNATKIINMLFAKLLTEQSDFLNFESNLAERWEFSSDSLSVMFYLRAAAVWHDGQPVTARDVRFTWQMQTDSLVAWPYRHIKDRIVDVEVIDDHTVTFHFKRSYPEQLMDANDGVIVPKHLLENIPRDEIAAAAFGRQPIGCGPFKFTRWESSQFVEIQRNPNYFGADKPEIQRIIYRVVPDNTTELTMLKTGDIDCVEAITRDATGELGSYSSDLKLYRYRSRAMFQIIWNVEDEVLKERRIRRAIAMGINAREIIETLWGGDAKPVQSPMHPMLWAHNETIAPIGYNPQRAKAELRKSGWQDSDGDGFLDKDGRIFEIEMMANAYPVYGDIVTLVQAQLRQIGVKVNARILEFNALIDKLQAGDFDSSVMKLNSATRVDIGNYWTSDAISNGYNGARYRNDRVDALIAAARSATTAGEAKRLWHECQEIIYEDQPVYFLAISDEVVALNRRFCNVEPSTISFFANLTEWRVGAACREQ